jgi:hypothetical protein
VEPVHDFVRVASGAGGGVGWSVHASTTGRTLTVATRTDRPSRESRFGVDLPLPRAMALSISAGRSGPVRLAVCVSPAVARVDVILDDGERLSPVLHPVPPAGRGLPRVGVVLAGRARHPVLVRALDRSGHELESIRPESLPAGDRSRPFRWRSHNRPRVAPLMPERGGTVRRR